MLNRNSKFTTLLLLSFLASNSIVFAQTRTASTNGIDQIIKWVKDGKTKKVVFPAGTYEFPQTITIENDDLILEGSGTNSTILKLTATKSCLIDAKANNTSLKNLTLDGNNQQKGFGNPIFRFNKSEGHHFESVNFKNSKWNAISSDSGWATDGLVAKTCVFSNISWFPIQIFNRNTNQRGGEVIVDVEKVVIDQCTFKTGYETGVSSDNGNDRRDDGGGVGRRYTESTSLNGTTIQNCTFEKTKQFHIAMVQSADVVIANNTFEGMTDDAGGGAQPLHFEQFSRDIEIYENTFSMADNVPKSYPYIHFQGTEGHKRVSQQRPSNTYPDWTYNVKGSNERRADTSCAKTGHINKGCKRDVHAYGARNIYIAGNIFNASKRVSHYVTVNEGEHIQIGTKKDGTISLNRFEGGDENTGKITFGGNDEGTGDVLILAGQGIVPSNVEIKDVSFDLPPCRLAKPIIVNPPGTAPQRRSNTSNQQDTDTGSPSRRSWTDRTGSFTLQAILVGVKNGKVALKRDDGSVTVLPLEQLSVADQKIVRELVAKHTELLFAD